jgi:hypothetical protein
MKTLILGTFLLTVSSASFSQSSKSEDSKNKTSGFSSGISTNTQTIQLKKKSFKLPKVIAPANNTIDANCADRLGKGDAGYTACEANKRTR